MRERLTRFSSAFTLIEVLVVAGILALLIAILLPSLAQARRSTRRVLCMTNLRSLGMGVHAYETAFKDILPWEGYAEGDRPIRSVGIWDEPSVWFNSCLTYAGLPAYSKLQSAEMSGGAPLPRDGSQHLLVCPDANPAAPGPKDDLIVDGYFMLWGLTADGLHPERRKTYWSYGYNTQLDEGVEDRHSPRRVSLGNFKRISEIPILVEKIMRPDEYDPPYGPFMSSVGQSEVSWHEFATRHNKGGHLLFLDNHVGYFSLQQILSAPRAPDDYNQPGKVVWNPAPGGVSR